MSNSLRDPNKAHYFDKYSKDAFWQDLQSLLPSKPEVWVWEIGQTEEELERFELIQVSKEKDTIGLKKKGSFLLHILGSGLINNNILFRIRDGKVNYFSTSILYKDSETKNYTLKVQDDVYISRQRSNYRLSASSSVIIKFKIDEEVFDALDISAGGTMIRVSAADKERFEIGKEFEECVTQFARKTWNITKVKVIKHIKEKETGALKVALQFLKVENEEDLVTAINSEARGEEVHKNFLNKKKDSIFK